MPDTSIDVVKERVEHLINKVDEGFTGIHDRQDKTNGAVAENTSYRLENKQLVSDLKKDRESRFRRYSDFAWKLGTALLAGAWGFHTIGTKIVGG